MRRNYLGTTSEGINTVREEKAESEVNERAVSPRGDFPPRDFLFHDLTRGPAPSDTFRRMSNAPWLDISEWSVNAMLYSRPCELSDNRRRV